jgi:hypothetical protein
MATIIPTSAHPVKGVSVVTWTDVGDSDTCVATTTAQYNRACVQTKGTFSSATIVLQGSNDEGTTFAPLTDLTGTAISHTSAGIDGVGESPLEMRPSSTGGSSSSTTIILTLSKD